MISPQKFREQASKKMGDKPIVPEPIKRKKLGGTAGDQLSALKGIKERGLRV